MIENFQKQVQFSEVDDKLHMKLDNVINAMQDCINTQSESIGRGVDYMMQNKRTWFVVGWEIEIRRYPRLREEIHIQTWPTGFSATLGSRNVVVYSQNSEVLVCADSTWAMMDMQAGSLSKITPQDVDGYEMKEKFPMEYRGRKIRLPKEWEEAEGFRVGKNLLDYNEHMSNGKYIEMAYEYLPLGETVTKIRAEYKNQSVYGERLQVKISRQDKLFIILFLGEQGEKKAMVEFVTE